MKTTWPWWLLATPESKNCQQLQNQHLQFPFRHYVHQKLPYLFFILTCYFLITIDKEMSPMKQFTPAVFQQQTTSDSLSPQYSRGNALISNWIFCSVEHIKLIFRWFQILSRLRSKPTGALCHKIPLSTWNGKIMVHWFEHIFKLGFAVAGLHKAHHPSPDEILSDPFPPHHLNHHHCNLVLNLLECNLLHYF